MRLGTARSDDFELNVISLIDVMLTLLMFFVMTTTFVQHSAMKVTLPEASETTSDAQRDAFIPPKPFESWVLNKDTCRWDAPVPRPNDGGQYTWDETTISWVEVKNV